MSRRILILTKTSALGGAERLLMSALPYLDVASYDYRFAALDGHGPLAEACREAGFPFGVLPARMAARLDPVQALSQH